MLRRSLRVEDVDQFIEGNDTMPTKREVLAVLGRDDLITCLDHVGLEVRDRRVKDDLVEALAATGSQFGW